MSNMQIQSVLAQMRALSQSSRIEGPAPVEAVKEAREPGHEDFAATLHEAVRGVNDIQQAASTQQTQFELGESSTSLPQVMIAMNKSSIAFEATNQVRNRLLSAYQEVMSMQV